MHKYICVMQESYDFYGVVVMMITNEMLGCR